MLSDDLAQAMIPPRLLPPDTPPVTEDDTFTELDALISTLRVNRADDGAFILGDLEAPITILVFEDWYCPHCQAYKPTIDQLIMTYVASGQVRYERRILPTAGGESTVILGGWIECVAEYGANYFLANNTLYDMMSASPIPATQAGKMLVEQFGLSLEKVEICAETADQVDIDVNFARELGASSTPSVWIRYPDGSIVAVMDRSFEGLSTLIEQGAPGSRVTLPLAVS